MGEFITTLLVGISTFIATNIDDIVILLVLFSQVNSHLKYRHIIAGQYLGFTVLVIASLPGLFGGFIIPANLIGFLGLVPIAMGISTLRNQKKDEIQEVAVAIPESQESNTANLFNTQVYNVAAITIANGSDNISVYVPLFASGDFNNFLIIIGVFFILIAIWCYLAYKFTRQAKIASVISKYSSYILPFVLIALGSFIVLKTQTLSLIKLTASCICLIILVKRTN
jgi:cadmium resistance transport/sequestration family protein